MEILKKLWVPITGIVGAITLVVQFIQLWKGDQATVTYVIAGLGVALVLFGFFWVALSREISEIDDVLNPGETKSKSEWRYSSTFRWLAFVGLLICLAGGITGGKALVSHRQEFEEKIIILVATFEGPEETYGVTNELVEQLTEAVKDFDDIQIVPLGEIITVEQGSDYAREKGKRYLADIVIWGWYRPTENPNVTIHVENINPEELTKISESQKLKPETSLDDLESFSFQQAIGGEMSAMVLFLDGYAYYLEKDYENASQRFLSVLTYEEWATDIVNRAEVVFLLGRIYFINENLQDAIDAFTEAIELDSGFVEAYNNRCISYGRLEQYVNAIEDCSMAIKLDPKYSIAYNNRCLAYNRLSEHALAVSDCTEAIRINPEYIKAHNNRGLAYYYMKDYPKAIIDFNKLLNDLDPNYVKAYNNRGLSYSYLGEYEKAIVNFSNAIELDPTHKRAYNNRGLAYTALQEYEKAISDFDEAIMLDTMYVNAHLNRGKVFLELGMKKEAISDFMMVLEITTDTSVISRAENYLEELGEK